MPIGPMGHVYRWRDVESYLDESPRPVFAATAASLADSGAGKLVLLHKIVTEILGRFPIHLQTIGDCVSHGWGLAIDVLKCVEIKAGEAEEFRAETATEAIYAASRVEIGKRALGSSDGSVGAWAAKAVKTIGTLTREKHGAIDLTTYDGQRARTWGASREGLPDAIEPLAREHPVQTASLVTSYEQARDAIANGFPVPVSSNQGFEEARDTEGFARASGSWSHCMLFLAVDDTGRRPGLLCMNSWGADWIRGPKRHDQPDGSFWVDAATADKMLRKNPDSFAISGFQGFPSAEERFDVF